MNGLRIRSRLVSVRENLLEFHSPDEMTRSLRNRTGYCVRAAPGALDETERA